MSQTQNLSTRNALCRLTLGFSLLSYGTAKMVRNPYSSQGMIFVFLGAMKAAEGTVKYCPIKAIMQSNGMLNHSGESQLGMKMQEFANDGMSVTT